MDFTLVYTKESEWWYIVEVLELPWCGSYWDNLEEAENMIRDTIKWYLISMKKYWNLSEIKHGKKFISSLRLEYETV